MIQKTSDKVMDGSKDASAFASHFLRRDKGFTLIEMMVSMFVFVMIMTASVGAFAGSFSARKSVRDMQKNLEEARTTMEMMAKNIRMSTGLGPAGIGNKSTIYFYNNSQDICIAYTFAGGKIKSRTYAHSGTEEDPVCPAEVGTEDMLSSNVSGSFYVVPNAESPSTIGKVTIMLNATVGTMTENMQTTISLRDYKQFFYP